MRRVSLQQVCALTARSMLWLIVVIWFWPVVVLGQSDTDIEREEPPLIDAPSPFDLITLTPTAGGGSFKVAPIPFPNRQLPSTRPKDTEKIQDLILLVQPTRRYEISWKDIQRIDLYEQMIYEEAQTKLKERDFVAAFMNLSFLMKNYSAMPNLEGLRRDFLFESAREMYRAKEYRQTLSALEELKLSAPGYNDEAVTRVLSEVANGLIESYHKAGELGNAKLLHGRLKATYGANLPVVELWDKRLEQLADQKRAEAEELLAAKRFREARRAAASMLDILPDHPTARELMQRINQIHPMIRVGVMQAATDLDPTSLSNWPARRAGALVELPLFRFLKTGSEGGKYGFALGTYRQSDDRQELILSLDPSIRTSLDAYSVSQVLLGRADPMNSQYDPSWAAIFKAAKPNSAQQLTVQLKRPSVLPHALMQWLLANGAYAGSLKGSYLNQPTDQNETSFIYRGSAPPNGQPVEIVEVFFDDPKMAVNELLRGELDILDQLYPADAKRLAIDPRIRIGAYALPSVHMVIPVSDHPYLAKDKFKRALLYASNRQEMLRGELLNSDRSEDGRLISGPFPIGEGNADQLSYAYDPNVAPVGYNPQLARLLLLMTDQELEEAAKKKNEEPPKLEKLIVACPNYEFARVAVQALIQQWANVGIKAEMVVLPPGKSVDPSMKYDMVYLITTPWEPATDIERLLGEHGVAASNNPFIVVALERLRAARNWKDVRTSLQDLHRLVDYHLPILPLWQITDRFAVTRYVEGVSGSPVSLYDSIYSWRLNTGENSKTE